MQTRTLGQSGLVSTRLAYGCWRIAGPGESHEISHERAEHARAAVRAAYEAGFRIFDHADIYAHGFGEHLFGEVLREIRGMREEILIASKCGIIRAGSPDPHAPYRYDSTAQHIIESCESSLRRLGVETIDIYMIHRPDFLGEPAEIAGAVSQLLTQGKIRSFGVSNFRPDQARVLQQALPRRLVVNQVEISLMKLDALHDGTLDHCQLEGIVPMAWGPLGGGKLTGHDSLSLQTVDHGHRGRIRDTADLIARHHGVARSAVLLAWLLRHPAGILPVVGSTQPEHIRQAAMATQVQLSREEWYQLMEAASGHRLP